LVVLTSLFPLGYIRMVNPATDTEKYHVLLQGDNFNTGYLSIMLKYSPRLVRGACLLLTIERRVSEGILFTTIARRLLVREL